MRSSARRRYFGVLLCSVLAGASAQAGWSVGVRFGGPGPCHGPCLGPCYGPYWRGYYYPYYAPPPVYVVPPAPVYVTPAPAVVAPAYPPPPPPPDYTPTLPLPRKLDDNVSGVSTGSTEHYLQDLANPDERVRLESVTQLGRLKSARAVDPLAATLAGDKSPAVREAAAKALGFIGSPAALPALNRAAQLDADHDVRRTARFAAEIIQVK